MKNRMVGLPTVALGDISTARRRAYGAMAGNLSRDTRAKVGGPDRDRTGDLLNAIQARSQLRYRPSVV